MALITTVAKGEFGHIYPISVTYQVGKKHYILVEDEVGHYMVMPINDDGVFGSSIETNAFSRYYDIMQAAYDDQTGTTYLCAVSLSGKYMEVFATSNTGLVSKNAWNFEIEDRKTFNFFFIKGLLFIYQGGEDSNGKYTVKSVRY